MCASSLNGKWSRGSRFGAGLAAGTVVGFFAGLVAGRSVSTRDLGPPAGATTPESPAAEAGVSSGARPDPALPGGMRPAAGPPQLAETRAPSAAPLRLRDEPRLDGEVLKTAIEVNQVLEPELDEAELRAGLVALADSVRKELAGAKTDADAVAALNRSILGDREVTYLSNVHWRDSTLSAALLRRKGNCSATAALYVVLGEMLGLPLRAVHVPRHVFARYEGARSINIETTAGGVEWPDSRYRVDTGFDDMERDDFGYGKSMESPEFCALLLCQAAGHLHGQRRLAEARVFLDRAAPLRPDDASLIIARAALDYAAPETRARALKTYAEIAQSPPEKRSSGLRTAATFALAQHAHSLGRQDDAIKILRLTLATAPKHRLAELFGLLSSCYRTKRDFERAALYSDLALVFNLRAQDPDDYVGLAIMLKNANRLEGAILALQTALDMNPESWNTRLILAGYLIRAGRDEEGWREFEKVKPPRTGIAHYHTNMAWFHGSVGKKAEFLDSLGRALELSRTPHILNYIRTEVDFDRYREDPDFKALVARHTGRLLGER